jgi:hypothetical protein
MNAYAATATEPSNAIQPRIAGPLPMGPNHVEAADLIAEGSLSITQIAAKVGTTRWTLWAWRQRPEFCRVLEQRLEFYRAEALLHGIAVREQRVKAQTDRWRRMQRIVEARAKDMQDIPGGDSGLLVRKFRGIGDGENFRVVEYYETDVGLLREFRSLEEHAARELDQWPRGSDTTAAREVNVEVEAMTNAELLERAKAVLRAAGELPPEAEASAAVEAGDP